MTGPFLLASDLLRRRALPLGKERQHSLLQCKQDATGEHDAPASHLGGPTKKWSG